MRDSSGDKARLLHILNAINEIESYLNSADIEIFLDNSMMRFASIKQLEIIGEASNHITEETKSNFSDIEWSQIIAMRNVFVHEYFGIDTTIVWTIIKNDIPELKVKIIEILKTLD